MFFLPLTHRLLEPVWRTYLRNLFFCLTNIGLLAVATFAVVRSAIFAIEVALSSNVGMVLKLAMRL